MACVYILSTNLTVKVLPAGQDKYKWDCERMPEG